MKYCVSRQNKHKWEANEIVYPANLLNTIIIDAVEHPNITFIARVDTLQNDKNPTLEQMTRVAEGTKNLIFSFCEIEDLEAYAKTPNAGRRMYNPPVSSWNMVNLLHSFGVEYIQIGEPFCFQKKNMIEYIKNERDIKLRINPTFVRPAIMANNKADKAICHNWILPQFTDLYEDWIDVFDLSDTGAEMRETKLFEIYQNVGEYQQPMQYLFMNFKTAFPAAFTDRAWIEKRLNCSQTCQVSSNRCHYCLAQQQVYEAMDRVKRKEKK